MLGKGCKASVTPEDSVICLQYIMLERLVLGSIVQHDGDSVLGLQYSMMCYMLKNR